jgi:hypothetical protein
MPAARPLTPYGNVAEGDFVNRLGLKYNAAFNSLSRWREYVHNCRLINCANKSRQRRRRRSDPIAHCPDKELVWTQSNAPASVFCSPIQEIIYILAYLIWDFSLFLRAVVETPDLISGFIFHNWIVFARLPPECNLKSTVEQKLSEKRNRVFKITINFTAPQEGINFFVVNNWLALLKINDLISPPRQAFY